MKREHRCFRLYSLGKNNCHNKLNHCYSLFLHEIFQVGYTIYSAASGFGKPKGCSSLASKSN